MSLNDCNQIPIQIRMSSFGAGGVGTQNANKKNINQSNVTRAADSISRDISFARVALIASPILPCFI